jgi:uncharacterized metal-binding protein YceD (DUF177 family)
MQGALNTRIASVMKYNREFEIAWQGLKSGPQSYSYDIDDRFMSERGADEALKNWNAKVTMVFDKHENFFMLHFDIDGLVHLPCDRCGDDYALRLWDEFDLIVKLTGEDHDGAEDEDDIVFIPRSETVLDVSGWIYEYMMLSIPLQHIHPDKPDGTMGCNPQAISLLSKMTDSAEVPANPIWKGLEQLKQHKDLNP